MKQLFEIQEAIGRVDENSNKYPLMTYEQGVYEALAWVCGEIPDEEFTFSGK